MTTAGIIGGIGPESTQEYYRLIIASYRRRKGDGSYPRVIVNSIDLKTVVDLMRANRLVELADHLLGELRRLERAGADFGALAANTPHIVFDTLRRESPIPLISIVEVTRQAAEALGLKRIGLFGTRYTMQGRFYPEVFAPAGITLVTPEAGEQDYIHEKYMSELVNGKVSRMTLYLLTKYLYRLGRKVTMKTTRGWRGALAHYREHYPTRKKWVASRWANLSRCVAITSAPTRAGP